MKKTNVFKKLIISVLALSMVLGNFCIAFAQEQSKEPESEPKAELVVSEIGYRDVYYMYKDTFVASNRLGKVGIAKFDGTIIVPFDYLVESIDYAGGAVLFKKAVGEDENAEILYDYYGFGIDGQELFKFDAKDVGSGSLSYYNGLLTLTTKEGKTFMDKDRNVILKISSRKKNEVADADESVKYGYTTTMLESNSGYVIVYYDGDECDEDTILSSYKPYLVSKDGYKELNIPLSQKKAPLKSNGKYIMGSGWVYSIDNNEYIPVKFKNIGGMIEVSFIGDKIVWVVMDESFGAYTMVFDDTGKTLFELAPEDHKFITVDCFNDVKNDLLKFFIASTETGDHDSYFYMDFEGKEYGRDFDFAYAGDFMGNHAIVLNQVGEAYVIDEKFNQITYSISGDNGEPIYSVETLNENAYMVKKKNARGIKYWYPAYVKYPTYTEELTEDKESIPSSEFDSILNENASKLVIIKNADGVEFTFKKGEMTVIDGKPEYNFGTKIIKDIDKAFDLSSKFNKHNFVMQIVFNYSGKLPAKADIKFHVGSENAGKTFYYYLCNDDKTYTLVQKVVVDIDGSVTVAQDHCSTYVLASEEIPAASDTDTETNTPADGDQGTDTPETESPETGDSTNPAIFIILIAASIVTMMFAGRKKAADRV